MNKKLLNTCIEALTSDHGKEIVNFYRSQGFDTGSYTSGYRYYGINVNGTFSNYFSDILVTLLTLKEAKLLVQEKTYPRVMLVNDENNIKTAFQRVVFMEKNSYFLGWGHAKTFEEAEKEMDIYHWAFAWELEEKTRFPFTLYPFNAQKIISVACNDWKEVLAKKWSKDIVLNQNILIDEQFYKEMRNACTTRQHELFDEIFGKN
jgi:hypothetical protein